MKYADSIVLIDDDFDHQNFPKQFSNQIYISSLSQFEPFGYVSNFSIKYIARGEEFYTINGIRKTLKGGQFLIINEGDYVISEKSKNGCISLGVSVFLEPNLLHSVYCGQNSMIDDHDHSAKSASIEFYRNIISNDKDLQNYFWRMFALRSSDKIDETIYLDLAEQLVNFQLRIDRTISSLSAKKKSTRFEIFRRVDMAHEFLNENTSKNFDLDELSEVACLSKYFLIKKFKEIYGMTPLKYHTEIRMRKAMEILREGYSVSDAAIMMGFSSVHYFSKTFKDLFGKSPSQYGLKK